MSNGIGQPGNMHEMVERLAIQEVLHAHSRGLDRCDEELVKSCYWPDAEVDYGNFKGPAHDFAGLVCKALAEIYELTQHCLSNSLVATGGEMARAETLVTAVHLLVGGKEEMSFSGRYLDRLERRNGGWKLLHRKVVMDWSRRHSIEDERESANFSALGKGTHGQDDPSYDFFAGKDS